MHNKPTAVLVPRYEDVEVKAIEKVLIKGDLSALDAEGRVKYVNMLCESLNLNPLTNPFKFIDFKGKLVCYAAKDCTEQLRNNNKISVTIVSREEKSGVLVVTAQAKMPSGRFDESIGAVCVKGLGGLELANAWMKAETKAKRRVTLSICGLGMLDETEVEPEPKEDLKPAKRAVQAKPFVPYTIPFPNSPFFGKKIEEVPLPELMKYAEKLEEHYQLLAEKQDREVDYPASVREFFKRVDNQLDLEMNEGKNGNAIE